MTKQLLKGLLALTLVLCVLPLFSVDADAAGSGALDYPYIITTKADQDAPAAPTSTEELTSTKVKLTAITTTGHGEVQYAYNTINEAPTESWQTSVEFNGLNKDTTYYFFARYAGDADYNPAASSGAEIKTLSTYTVSYDISDAETGTAPESQTKDVGESFTAALAGDIAKTGHTFLGWSKTKGATIADYAPGAAVSDITADQTLYSTWKADQYTVTFDANGGESIAERAVTFDQKYGTLPNTLVKGLRGGKDIWYLVDAQGNITDTKITPDMIVSEARDHTLIALREVLKPTASIKLTAPGCISDGYKYYNPVDSTRILTVTVGNMNNDILSYTYKWYKDGAVIDGETSSVLTLEGNVSDSGVYKVEVTATLKDDAGIIVTAGSATGSKEKEVKIARATNTLLYNANGGKGGASSEYSNVATAKVTSRNPSKTGYTFTGWDTQLDGKGVRYMSGNVYTFENDNGNGGCKITLYAQWTPNSYTIKFNGNGAQQGGMADVTYIYDEEYILPVNNFTNIERYFSGWNTAADGSGDAYEDFAKVKNLASEQNAVVTLYAQWNVVAKYGINSEIIGNGEVKTSLSKAAYATPVTITVRAAEGYALKSIEVKHTYGATVTPVKNDDGTYNFKMPATSVTIKAEFERVEHICPSAPYGDVDTGKWYHEYIDYVIEKDLMIGTEINIFDTHGNTSRAMIATILYRMEGSPKISDQASFPDVKQGVWYTDAIVWAAENEIVLGYDTGRFEPDRDISRQELAVILYRYAGYKGMDITARADLNGYTDADSVSSWAKEAMQWAAAVGIISGDDANCINGKAAAERCEVAAMIKHYAELAD